MTVACRRSSRLDLVATPSFLPPLRLWRLIRPADEINIEEGKDRNSKSLKLLGLAGLSKKGKQTKRRQCEEGWRTVEPRKLGKE